MAIRKKIPSPPDGQPRDAELIPVKTAKELVNVYELEDGSVISFKVVVTEIWRVDGVYDNEGNPSYIVRSANIVTITAPENLRRRSS